MRPLTVLKKVDRASGCRNRGTRRKIRRALKRAARNAPHE